MSKLVLITYRLRDGTDPVAFREFMVSKDIPLFRAHPKVRSYRAFEVVADWQGRIGFTNFDLLEVDDFADFDALLADETIGAHSMNWQRMFGEFGADVADLVVNFRVQLCDEIGGDPSAPPPGVAG